MRIDRYVTASDPGTDPVQVGLQRRRNATGEIVEGRQIDTPIGKRSTERGAATELPVDDEAHHGRNGDVIALSNAGEPQVRELRELVERIEVDAHEEGAL